MPTPNDELGRTWCDVAGGRAPHHDAGYGRIDGYVTPAGLRLGARLVAGAWPGTWSMTDGPFTDRDPAAVSLGWLRATGRVGAPVHLRVENVAGADWLVFATSIGFGPRCELADTGWAELRPPPRCVVVHEHKADFEVSSAVRVSDAPAPQVLLGIAADVFWETETLAALVEKVYDAAIPRGAPVPIWSERDPQVSFEYAEQPFPSED